MHAYTQTHKHTNTHTHHILLCTFLFIHICIYVCMYTRLSVCMSVRMYVRVCTCVYTYRYLCICVCVCVDAHKYLFFTTFVPCKSCMAYVITRAKVIEVRVLGSVVPPQANRLYLVALGGAGNPHPSCWPAAPQRPLSSGSASDLWFWSRYYMLFGVPYCCYIV